MYCDIGPLYRDLFQLNISQSASVAFRVFATSGFSGSDASPQSIFCLVDHRRHICSSADFLEWEARYSLPARIRL